MNYLQAIINPVQNFGYYNNYKNQKYLNEIFLKVIKNYNDSTAKWTTSELKQLEAYILKGKSKSILADSLYLSMDILAPLTVKHAFTEKNFMRILEVLQSYKQRYPVKEFSFTWVYNLKKNNFVFTEEVINILKSIGFTFGTFLTKTGNIAEVELSQISSLKSGTVNMIKTVLEKYPDYILTIENYKQILKTYYSVITDDIYQPKDNIIFDRIVEVTKLFVKHKYVLTNNDISEFINTIELFLEKRSYFSNKKYDFNNFLKSMLGIFAENKIEFDSNNINHLFETLKTKYISSTYINTPYDNTNILIYIIKMIKLPKKDYLSMIAFNTSELSLEICNSHCNLIEYLKTNDLLEINQDTLYNAILICDKIIVEYLIENESIVLNNTALNYSIMTCNLTIIKLMINNKCIPTLENLKYLPKNNPYQISPIFDYLILSYCITVNKDLIEFLISQNIRLNNLNKLELVTGEMNNMIINYSVKHLEYPYDDNLKTKYSKIFAELNEKDDFPDNYFNDFDTDEKLEGLLKHLIINNNKMTLIIKFKNKFPHIKPSIKSICISKYADALADIFGLNI